MTIIKFPIYVQPGAKQTGFAGYFAGKIKIKLNAPAQDNKANQELIVFLAKKLNLAKNNILLVQGLTNRHKVVSIDSDYSAAEIVKKITE
ncbi:MAG: DUF167 domain-containing protein [Candidatus Margulisbacteria bacterium]|jgi:uncharacterized protein (TIGR00251 family)|nr:DUF167 domain-containing protein [Candidatus Margulisiibacteriota bacterium]